MPRVPHPELPSLAVWLRWIRDRRGLSQRELGALLDIKQADISKAETGLTRSPITYLRRLKPLITPYEYKVGVDAYLAQIKSELTTD